MNGKITQALSDTASGDIMKYFQEMDAIIQLNDGIHDCKMLSMECYDRPTQVKYNQYTKFHLSDAGIDCINIDKSYITATITYHMKLSKVCDTLISGNDRDGPIHVGKISHQDKIKSRFDDLRHINTSTSN